MMNKQDSFTGLEIAVIGMAGRFPGANNIESFWENLKKGIESVTFFSDDELVEAGVDESLINHPNYVKAKRNVEGKEYFDSAFFGYVPEEARLMDPQVRIFHQCVWHALEDAGYNSQTYPGLIGLYAGAVSNFNWEAYSMLPQAGNSIDDFTAGQLRSRDFLTTLVSHKLNLKGPTVFIQTACSTSLAAIHMACRGLLMGEANIALAGGVCISNAVKQGYLYQEGIVSSPDGHCRAFDARAGGIVGGEGAGVVVLKKLKKAIADRDNIYAVIKGSAINNDGVRKVGFSAPSVDGQADVIRMAHKTSRIDPRSISYVETHGTGTALGDPVEVEALTQAFGKSKEKYCGLGSVKSNIGHLDAAAGVASFIKTVLALKHRQIPPSLHFKTPNPKIAFDNSPFYVNTVLKEWKTNGYPCRAGVSSFGIGGTNAHIVLEEAPVFGETGKERENQLIVLSARSESALDKMSKNLANYLKENNGNPGPAIADIAFTLQVGRKPFKYRQMLVCSTAEEAFDFLSSPGSKKIRRFVLTERNQNPRVIFMFPGLGSQYVNMGRELYESEPVFREEMDRCFDMLESLIYYDVKEVLYPGSTPQRTQSAQLPDITQIEIAQVVVFIVEYALAKLLMKWGIKPYAMIGYSFGEYTAACISGVLSLADALKLIVSRGKLITGLPPGAMLSVPISGQELNSYLIKDLSLAIDNGPSCIVAGSVKAIDAFETRMKKNKIMCVRLQGSHAIHSQMMNPVLPEFAEIVETLTLDKPQIPYIANVTGNWITAGEAASPAYWINHLREPVRFADGMKELVKDKRNILVEVGPGRDLSTLAVRYVQDSQALQVMYLMPPSQREAADGYFLLKQIGRLWLNGVSVDWEAYYSTNVQKRNRISLPPYPFEKIPYPVNVDMFKIISTLINAYQNKENQPLVLDTWNSEIKESENRENTGYVPGTGIITAERPDLETPYVEPVTPTEKALTEIWRDFFGVAKIGIKDDFFDLGGDSLRAMNISTKIHQQLNVEVPVNDFFASPTIENLGKRIDASTKKKFIPIEPVEEKEYYPASSAQKRLYFHYHLNVHSIDYNLVQIHRLEGEIHAHKLESIFNTLIQRHESLRTSFHTIAGEPVQRIQEENSKFQITNSKGGGTPIRIRIPDHKSQITNIIEDFVQPFDLSKAPLLRVGLIRLEQDQYILVVDMHHIISDGTSQGILTTEFMLLHQGIELLELKARYRDYTYWQQRKQQTGEIKKQEAYWLQQFAGDIPLLDIPIDYPRPAPGSRTYEGGKIAFQIDKQTLGKINLLVSGEGMTLFFVLLAVFNILLSKYTGKQDIVVGTGSAGRRHTDLAGIIGIFIHVLPMRNHPGKNKTFSHFLREVKMNALDAYENEDYPFEELVKALNIQGKTPLNPLFDAALELVNIELPENKGSGMSMKTSIEEIPQAAHYDITIYAIKTTNSVDMLMVYAKELFKPSTAKKMADHYMEILNQVLSNVNIEISTLDVLTEAEKKQLLFEFNRFAADGTFPVDYPRDTLIQHVFEAQVEKTPDALAMVYQGRQLTYRQLNEKANMLAHVLRSKGIIADTLVALMVDPSIETTVGILGILKAGGAYLPIHHETPTERFLSILKDSRVSLVLTKTDILQNQSFTALQGLRRQEMKPYLTKLRPSITDFDTIPFPDRSLVNYEKFNRYIGHNLIQDCISLQATRGCPFNCAYCHKIWPKKHVARSAENIFQEVRFNYNLGIRRFSFVDDIFNYNRKNSQRFFELIIEHQLDLHLFYLMRGDMLTREYIDLMVEAGLIRLGLALETASPRLQKLIGKHLNIEKLRANIEYIAEKYPHVILELYTMHGFPSETKEEAMMTMNFIKSIKWLHFPYIFILTIFPNTEMEKLALDNGIPAEAIDRSLNLAYHELPDTLPFEKDFTIKYQAEFLNDYFLSKERLIHVLPLQMKNLTEAEMVQKYNSYLPIDIKSFNHLLEFFDLRREDLTVKECMEQKRVFVPDLNKKFKAAFPPVKPAENALRLLLLDLSQNFSTVHGRLDEMIEPPLGLMYLMTYLNHLYKEKINGKIAKSMIDFDSFAELKALLEDFQPQIIGIRTLSLYHDFFHETVQKIRHWGIDAPILTGGPYATSSYHTLLQDTNIDLVVLGEGEITLAELMGRILENNGKFPTEEELKEIPGIVFIPKSEKKSGKYAREIITLDDFTLDHLSHYTSVLSSGFTQNPYPVNQPYHLVYSIYTSGSTGLPKGVMLEHRHLNRLVYGLKERIYSRYNQPLNLSLIAPHVFDASVKQIFAALVQGHVLHIVPDEVRVDGPALLQFYKEHCIDVSDGTPTLIRLILETLAQIKADNSFTLKHLIIGGEVLPKEKVRALFHLCKENSLVITNVYGPTECTVDSTSFEVTAQRLEGNEKIPIGKPMPFDFIYILSMENKLVPIGVPGELCIGGFKVARGYLNNPELTSEKFCRGPGGGFSKEPPGRRRLYKTGDLARWLADGNIEFLGRMDRQVKIRGLRIELAEIENRIAALYEIKEAVVTAKTDEHGDSFLCAYIVPETRIETSQLRRTLSHYLPEYMIPAYFVPMAELPLTTGGKIDWNAMPHPDDSESRTGQLAAPRNTKEEQLIEIIKKVLGRKNVGIYENIFTIGADSIKTIQIAYRMKEAGYNLEIRNIFENPTAAALAPKVSEIKRMADQSVIIGEVPLSPVQEEFFQIYKIDPHHFNHSVMFYSEERLNPGALEAVVIKLQEHHDALRMTYKKGEDGQIIQWNHGLDYPHWFRVFDYRNLQDALAALAEECNRIQASIDLETGPLLKIALFQLDDGDRLLAALHHLVVDGMSWRILFEDIGALYNHYNNHPGTQQPKLPPKSDSFKLWGERVRQHANNHELLEEKNYWTYVEASPMEPIKRDFPEENAFIKDLLNLSIALTEEETETLFSRVNPAMDTEITDILLTGLGSAFKKACRQETLVVALEGHGRDEILEDVDVGRTVGWFTSIYLVVLDFSKEIEISSRIKEVKGMLRQVPNKGIGYGILKYITAEEHKKEIEFKLKPQIGFNYLGQFDTDVGHLSFVMAKESPGHTHSLEGIRKYDFTVTGIVAAKRLMISMAYSKKQYKPETVKAVLDYYQEVLRTIIQAF
jgi:amino acid adenylation domain-containing protein/non-ribosomal peptide synthase protein (TIGR01720 family)